MAAILLTTPHGSTWNGISQTRGKKKGKVEGEGKVEGRVEGKVEGKVEGEGKGEGEGRGRGQLVRHTNDLIVDNKVNVCEWCINIVPSPSPPAQLTILLLLLLSGGAEFIVGGVLQSRNLISHTREIRKLR